MCRCAEIRLNSQRVPAAHYELTGSQVTKYYFAGATRIAMRKYTIPSSMTVEYFLGGHLGSTSLTTDANGAKASEMRYKPRGRSPFVVDGGETENVPRVFPRLRCTRGQPSGRFSMDAGWTWLYPISSPQSDPNTTPTNHPSARAIHTRTASG